MAEDVYPMTKDGQIKLEKELEDLKTNQRPHVIEQIKIARSYRFIRKSEYNQK